MDEAAALRPDQRLTGFLRPLLNAGRSHYRSGEMQLAKTEFLRICSVEPSNHEANLTLARIAESEGDWEEAAVRWQIVSARELTGAHLTRLARARHRSGDLIGAAEAVEAALAAGANADVEKLRENVAKQLLYRTREEMKKGDETGAFATLHCLLRLEPDNHEAVRRLEKIAQKSLKTARVAFASGEFALCAEFAAAAASSMMTDPEPLLLQARALTRLRSNERALPLWFELSRMLPEREEVWLNLSRSARQQRDLAAMSYAVTQLTEIRRRGLTWAGANAEIPALLHQMGDLIRAFALYKQRYRESNDPAALLAMFRILLERHRFTAAARIAKHLKNPRDAIAADLTTLALIERDTELAREIVDESDAAHGPRPQIERLKRTLKSLEDELGAGDTMTGIRHVAIGGVSYVGSTIFGVILGSMDGFANAGESHWLTHIHDRETGARVPLLEAGLPPEKWPVACRICGRSCTVFTEGFRSELARDELGKYAKIATHLGVAGLVTSDKNLHNYWERDPLFRFDFVLLFKSPEQQVRSNLKQAIARLGPEAGEAEVFASIERILDQWAREYLGHLKIIRPTGRRVVVQWDRLVEQPHAHLNRMGERLALPLDGDILERIRIDHFIGGNMGVDAKETARSRRIELRASNAPPLGDGFAEAIRVHKRSQYVYALLLNEYHRDFCDLAEGHDV